jgi:hypothetical protein
MLAIRCPKQLYQSCAGGVKLLAFYGQGFHKNDKCRCEEAFFAVEAAPGTARDCAMLASSTW